MAETRLERLLRKPERSRETSFLELFFDLAIIFALAQFSQRLLRNFGWENSLQTLVLLAAVWWLWVGAARMTDWLEPDAPYVQRLLVVVMVAGLLAAAATPEAFGKHGLVFAGAYVVGHLARHLPIAGALGRHPVGLRSLRASAWFGTTAVLWLAGAFLPAGPRLLVWAVAVGVDYLSVGLGWPVPRLGRVREEHLRIFGEHIAERHRQIFIVAVGELLLASGITFSQTRLDIVRLGAFALAFASAGLLCWLYFLPRGLSLAKTLNRGPSVMAIRASYAHVVMIAGIVVTAMGAEILISRPLGETRAVWSAAIMAGPFLYLGGRALYAWTVFHRRAWRAPVGMLLIAAAAPGLFRLPPLAVASAVNLLLLGIVLDYRRIGPAAVRVGDRLERLLRKREDPRAISSYELFFDLAMIVAATRVSQRMLADLDPVNVAESLVLLAAIWWVWIATAWLTDWFNPDEPYLQRLIVGIMFAWLLMAAAVPSAFGEHGLLFAGAYAAIHVVRGIVIVPALRGSPLQVRSARVLVWFSISAVLWLVGALLPAGPRLALWLVAIMLDRASAWLGWPVPGLNRSPQRHLRVIGEHIAERYRQIYVISLGALVLLSGLAYAGAGFDWLRTLAFALAFANATLLLYSYFLPHGRDLGTAVNATTPRTAVAAAYCHGIMVAGAVVAAAGAEMLIRRPVGEVSAAWSLTIIGGVALHVVGRTVFGMVMFNIRRPWRGLLALLVLGGVTPGLLVVPPLVVAAVVNVVLFGLVLAYHRATVSSLRNRT